VSFRLPNSGIPASMLARASGRGPDQNSIGNFPALTAAGGETSFFLPGCCGILSGGWAIPTSFYNSSPRLSRYERPLAMYPCYRYRLRYRCRLPDIAKITCNPETEGTPAA
jgi:hypothetical protein